MGIKSHGLAMGIYKRLDIFLHFGCKDVSFPEQALYLPLGQCVRFGGTGAADMMSKAGADEKLVSPRFGRAFKLFSNPFFGV